MPAPESNINLVPASEFESTLWGKFLRWAVTTGRYIIIITELIVILAFLSRFKLDADIAQLNSEIKGKISVLDASFRAEQNFRKAQKKAEAVKGLISSQLNADKNLTNLTQIMPAAIRSQNVSLEKGKITISGWAPEEAPIGVLVKNISASANWKNVTMDKIGQDKKGKIEFLITIMGN